ncbi:MAG: pentapeptide repeat-containing protein [Rickettsiales bacterium]|nr:pentapeptide repeat-containing protein [Rickettsiales bacterium]
MKKKIILKCTEIICNTLFICAMLLWEIFIISYKTIIHSIVILLSASATICALVHFNYSTELTSLWNRVNNLTMQAEHNNKVLQKIPTLQNKTLPYKPSLNPLSIYHSFFEEYNQRNIDVVKELQDLAIQNKENLNNLNLRWIDLGRIDFHINLSNANFSKSVLIGANFKKADLGNSNFEKSCLYATNLSNTQLLGTNFKNTNLCNADLTKAIIYKTNFSKSVIAGANLSKSLIDLPKKSLEHTKYNSEEISLGKALTKDQLKILCGDEQIITSINCEKEIKEIKIPPTIFPQDSDFEKYDMIDLSNP